MSTLPALPDDLSRSSYTKQHVGINTIKHFLPRILDVCGLGQNVLITHRKLPQSLGCLKEKC